MGATWCAIARFPAKGNKYFITIRATPCWLGKLVGRKPYEFRVIGNNTVWNYFPSFKSCSASVEIWLWEANERLEYFDKAEKNEKD